MRLAPTARRQQILAVATRLLTSHGAARVEIKEVAKLAGVTRPVIYRFFPTRLALIQGVLDDFEQELSGRFQRALLATVGDSLPAITTAFIDACADAIEARGKGPWHLMYARSPDLDAAQLGRAVQARMLAPWLPRVAELTAQPLPRVRLLAEIVVAAGGAALDGWLEGPLSRHEAVRIATRAVAALLRDFTDRSTP